ncbi:MAG: hypothetical protein ACYC1M_04980 [Armatimonadota bacterium]
MDLSIACLLLLAYPYAYRWLVNHSRYWWHYGIPVMWIPDVETFELCMRVHRAKVLSKGPYAGLYQLEINHQLNKYAYFSYIIRNNGVLLMTPLLYPCSKTVVDSLESLVCIVGGSNEIRRYRHDIAFLVLMFGVATILVETPLIYLAFFMFLPLYDKPEVTDAVLHYSRMFIGEPFPDVFVNSTTNYNLMFCYNNRCLYRGDDMAFEVEVSKGHVKSCEATECETSPTTDGHTDSGLRRKIIAVVVCIALAVWFAMIVANGFRNAHMQIHLPGNYVLYQAEGGGVRYGCVIENRHLSAGLQSYIGPNIGEYRVYARAITGLITPHHNDDDFERHIPSRSTEDRERRLGYFVIDLRTNKVYGGLNEQDWMAKLSKYGISNEPVLHKPSWRDEMLGRNKPSD